MNICKLKSKRPEHSIETPPYICFCKKVFISFMLASCSFVPGLHGEWCGGGPVGAAGLLPLPAAGGGRSGGCGGRVEGRGGQGVRLLPHGGRIIPHLPQAQRTGGCLICRGNNLSFQQGNEERPGKTSVSVHLVLEVLGRVACDLEYLLALS